MHSFRVNDWLVSPQDNSLRRGNEERRVEPRVMDLLVYLAQHSGEVCSHDQILTRVWPHRYVTDGALQTAVSALRKTLDDTSKTVLVTIPKRGYRLAAEVSRTLPVLGVLPFTTLPGQGAEQQPYLADGVSDLLISALGRYPMIRVISRQSMSLAARTDPGEVAKDIGVTHLLEGSVHETGPDVSISVRLLDVTQNSYIWSYRHTTRVEKLFSDQDQLAALLVRQLTNRSDGVQPGAELEVSAEAMEAFLYGRYHWNKLNPEHFPTALNHLRRAVQLSPVFPAAYAGIADVWGAFGYWGVMPASEIQPHFQAALTKARKPDPLAAEVQMMEGAYEFHIRHDWPAALDHLQQAAMRNPNLTQAYLLTALVLGTIKDAAAFDAIETAYQLDPLSAPTLITRALLLAGAGRYEDTRQQLDRVLDLDPEFPPALELCADLAWARGDDDALEYERRLWKMDPEVRSILDTAEAPLRSAAEFLQRRNTYTSPRVMARLLALAEESHTAIRVLLEAVSANDLMQVDFVMMAPAFARVRSDPAFAELADRLALPAED